MENDNRPHIDDLPFETALKLYQQLRQAMHDDDTTAIADLRNRYPSLFDPDTANRLREANRLANKITGKKDKIPEH
jgi:hypothetical protein